MDGLTEANIARFTLPTLVDKMGELKAEIADLEEKWELLKARFVSFGLDEAEGNIFRATKSEYDSTKFNKEGLTKDMGEEWVAKYILPGKRVVTVKVSARRGIKLARVD